MFNFNFGGKKYEVLSGNVSENKVDPFAMVFDSVYTNRQKIGAKEYANINVDLLMIDESYQRVDTYSKAKVSALAEHFDISRMDTLMVSVHPEEKRFYVIDGMHRMFAAKAKGVEMLPCEILTFEGTPEERRKKEAKHFISQQEFIDKMSPLDQHKANIVLGDRACVALDAIVKGTNGAIHFKNNRNRGKQPVGTLTGYSAAVTMVKRKGKAHAKNVFDVLIGAGWNNAGTGLGNDSIRVVSDVLFAHGDDPQVKAEIARVLLKIDPYLFRASGRAAYKLRKPKCAYALYLEDIVCDNLNIPRLIDREEKIETA